MARVRPSDETCPIARAVTSVGDWWTLLILRDVLLRGSTRFEQFHRRLGIATNVLAQRLSDLVDQGVLERVPMEPPSSRYEYRPTQKGVDLWPILAAFLQWGNQWAANEQAPPVRLAHTLCGGAVRTIPECDTCGEPLSTEHLHVEPLRRDGQKPSKSRSPKATTTAVDGKNPAPAASTRKSPTKKVVSTSPRAARPRSS